MAWPTLPDGRSHRLQRHSKQMLAEQLAELGWAWDVQHDDNQLTLIVHDDWPPLVECDVFATDDVRFNALFRQLANDLDERFVASRNDPVVRENRRWIDGAAATSPEVKDVWALMTFAVTLIEWSGRTVPGETARNLRRLFDWFLARMPGGSVQGLRFTRERERLRTMVNVLAQLPFVPHDRPTPLADHLFAGRGPFANGYGLAVPLTYSHDRVWGFASVYPASGFLFLLPHQCRLPNVSYYAGKLFSLAGHWAGGYAPSALPLPRIELYLPEQRHFLVWNLERVRALDALLLNPLTFAANNTLNLVRQRQTIATWEMARSYVEQMLASTEWETRAETALLALDKLVYPLGRSSIRELFVAKIEQKVIETLEVSLGTKFGDYASAAWRMLCDEVEDAAVVSARPAKGKILLIDGEKDTRSIMPDYINALRNLVHGYGEAYDAKSARICV